MSDEARMLGESARGILSDHGSSAEDPWKPICEGGWIGVGVDEERGGAGGTLVEAAALAEAAGAVGSVAPVTEAIGAAIVLGAADRATGRLAELVAGDRRAVLASGLALDATRDCDGRLTVSTDGWAIPHAQRCTDVVIALREPDGTGAVALVALDGLPTRATISLAGEPRAAVLPERVAVDPFPVAAGPAHLEAVSAIVGAARLVGAMRSAHALSLAHARDRRQFGRAIGSFQAIAHALVGQVGELAQASAALDMAARSAGAPMLAYAARVIADRAARPVAEIAHQVHGAIGTTHEHELHRFTLRLLSWRLELGHPRAWRVRLADGVVERGSPWWSEFDEAAAIRERIATV
jgi:acyl-CoA dehydrogenase